MGDTSKMCLDDVLDFRYINQKENCQHLSNVNYLNRLGYTCQSCAIETYRNQDVHVLKTFLSQVQNEINKIENNNVHSCCACVGELREDIRSLKKLFNNFQQDRQFWLEENKNLKNELEELKKRVENSNEKEKTLNISVKLTGASDLNVNISTKQDVAEVKPSKPEGVALKITFDKAKREQKEEKEIKVSDIKSFLVSKPESIEKKPSIKAERKVFLNDVKQKTESVPKCLRETKLKTDDKQARKRIYKSDFLTNVRPRVKDIVHHYHNELKIISEKDVPKSVTNLEKVRVRDIGYKKVQPEIKMFQRQEKTRNVWVSENRLVSENRSSQKAK